MAQLDCAKQLDCFLSGCSTGDLFKSTAVVHESNPVLRLSPSGPLMTLPINKQNDVNSAHAFQDAILPGVSRTFALTIPQLPSRLRHVVANAYLLCRIADTIEDEASLPLDRKEYYQDLLAGVVAGRGSAEVFANEFFPLLSASTLPAERDLVRNTASILKVTSGFSERQRTAIERCITIMCRGMHRFQGAASRHGLHDMRALDDYCYHVAGVVGEMLTDLFCDYSPQIAERQPQLRALAVSFGQGLQMTNILKDVWDDLERGVCWYPRSVFARHQFDLSALSTENHGRDFAAGLHELVTVAHGHLRNALTYTLLIPAGETGIRRFCAWAIGMAVLTLRKLEAHPEFTNGSQVKISHSAVAWTTYLTRVGVRSDRWLTMLFDLAARSLPAPADISLAEADAMNTIRGQLR